MYFYNLMDGNLPSDNDVFKKALTTKGGRKLR
jgi:hypothetical protein